MRCHCGQDVDVYHASCELLRLPSRPESMAVLHGLTHVPMRVNGVERLTPACICGWYSIDGSHRRFEKHLTIVSPVALCLYCNEVATHVDSFGHTCCDDCDDGGDHTAGEITAMHAERP